MESKLVGAFNVYNMTAVCAGALALRMDMERVCALLGRCSPAPGRMEKVAIGAPFSVIVDYAHTPDALDNVLATARSLISGRLICVFGCGGDRDRTKRPRMAQAVVRHCHEAIVTSDNPRTEKPDTIIAEIMQGVPLDFPHWVIADRRAAIARALSIARPGDCVVIAGKGHEDYQEVNGVRHHFSDHEVVAEEYDRLASGKVRQ
jgi:UDP-N-acetylmuramoyl-L-alanyl-D-glutamate--2,6-diaminopimelate ligase